MMQALVMDAAARHKATALALGFVALGLGLAFDAPELRPWGDNAQFIVVAKSIVAGQGLREINHPDRPVHRKYPAGFPLMLAAVEWLQPDAFGAMKVMVLVQFVLSTVLIYWLLLLWSSERIALAVSLLFCSSQLALQFASEVMSEIPFVCFSVLTLLLHELGERVGERPAARWLFGGVVLASIWALMLRSVGVALIGALCLRLALRRRWWRAGILAAAGVVVLVVHSSLRGPGADEYTAAYLLVDYYDTAKGQLTLLGFLGRVLSNLRRYGLELIPGSVVPWPGSSWLFWPLALLCAGGLLRLLRRGHLAALYFGASLALLLAWPQIWAIPRYLVPLLPLTLLCAATALVWLGGRLRQRWTVLPEWAGTAAASVLVAVLALVNLAVALDHAPERDPRWRRYVEGLEWLRDNTPPTSVVMCRKPYFGFLHSRRRTVPTIRSSAEAGFLAALRQIDYVVVDSLPLPGTRESLIPNLERHRARFELVYHRRGPPLWIFRHRAGPTGTGRPTGRSPRGSTPPPVRGDDVGLAQQPPEPRSTSPSHAGGGPSIHFGPGCRLPARHHEGEHPVQRDRPRGPSTCRLAPIRRCEHPRPPAFRRGPGRPG